MITLLLKSPDRDLLLKALQVYKEELAQAEEAIRNPVLRNDFSHQLNVATELETAIHNAVDNALTDAELINRIAEFKPRNEKINAIKFLREQRHMGLKEAKDYVEQVWANPPKLLDTFFEV